MGCSGLHIPDLMTRVIEKLEPSIYPLSYEDLAPVWEEPQLRVFKECPPVLSTYGVEEQSVGWFPPLFASPSRYADPTPAPTVCVPPTFFSDYVYHNIPSPQSFTSECSTPTLSPSPPPSPTRGLAKGPIPRSRNVGRSPDRSPLLRNEKKRIRQTSGVKPKTKVRKTRAPSQADAAPSITGEPEMVKCEWADCTEEMIVDYISVKHWGAHIREHTNDEPNLVRCRWSNKCDVVIQKSSLWKHIVVHDHRFKLRCPLGCNVYTRGDMMKRHLNSCMFRSRPRRGCYEDDELYDGDSENI